MADQGLPTEVIVGLMQNKLGEHLQTLHEIEKPSAIQMLAYSSACQAWMQSAGILMAVSRRNQKIKTVGNG